MADLFPQVEIADGVTLARDVTIGAGTSLGSGVRIYPGTRIGSNVQILENSVLGRATVIPATSSVVKRVLTEEITGLVIGDSTVIGANVVLYRGSEIGEACIICDLTSIREECRLGKEVLLGRAVMIQVNTTIGDRVKIMDCCHLPGDMLVEDDVFMSTHVGGASESSLGRTSRSSEWSGPTLRARSYFGANATLLPGVEIGEDAVVAAGALVSKSVPSKTLVMGVPAREVRRIEPRDD